MYTYIATKAIKIVKHKECDNSKWILIICNKYMNTVNYNLTNNVYTAT